MGRDPVRARHVSDQSDRLQNALRSRQRRVRGLRRILHRHPIAARRIVPALAAVRTVAALCRAPASPWSGFPVGIAAGTWLAHSECLAYTSTATASPDQEAVSFPWSRF